MAMTTPRDDIAGLSERLRIKAAMIKLGEKIAFLSDAEIMQEAAAQLDALLKERDAPSARVKELEGLYDRHAELLASKARQITNGRTLYDAANARAEAAEARALRAEQERDEAKAALRAEQSRGSYHCD